MRHGFDFVEIHGAHAYLINEFLTPRYNRRTDEYGGPFENRIRFLLEVVREVRKRVGHKTPVGVRMCGDDFIGEDGWQLSEALPTRAHAGEGRGRLHQRERRAVPYGTIQINIAPMYEPQGAFVRFAAEVKKHVSIPVGTVGRIKDPVMADRIVKEGQADFVCMGRAQLADPETGGEGQEGRYLADIRPCLAECLGCIEGIFRHGYSQLRRQPQGGAGARNQGVPGREERGRQDGCWWRGRGWPGWRQPEGQPSPVTR